VREREKESTSTVKQESCLEFPDMLLNECDKGRLVSRRGARRARCVKLVGAARAERGASNSWARRARRADRRARGRGARGERGAEYRHEARVRMMQRVAYSSKHSTHALKDVTVLTLDGSE